LNEFGSEANAVDANDLWIKICIGIKTGKDKKKA